MKAQLLRIGNIVKPIYESETDSVIAIEDGSVHLSRKNVPDDERDIEGVAISEFLLKEIGFVHLPDGRFIYKLKGQGVLQLRQRDTGWQVVSKSMGKVLKLQYIHEIQNLLQVFQLVN